MSRRHREELKRLWFSLDRTNIPERKEIIVETEFGHVEVTSDGPDGYNSFKTNKGKGDACINYGIYQKLENPEYELIIDGTIIK